MKLELQIDKKTCVSRMKVLSMPWTRWLPMYNYAAWHLIWILAWYHQQAFFTRMRWHSLFPATGVSSSRSSILHLSPKRVLAYFIMSLMLLTAFGHEEAMRVKNERSFYAHETWSANRWAQYIIMLHDYGYNHHHHDHQCYHHLVACSNQCLSELIRCLFKSLILRYCKSLINAFC